MEIVVEWKLKIECKKVITLHISYKFRFHFEVKLISVRIIFQKLWIEKGRSINP